MYDYVVHPHVSDYLNIKGEAVAEVQPGGVDASTPLGISLGDPPSHRRRNAYNFKAEPIYERVHYEAEAPPARLILYRGV